MTSPLCWASVNAPWIFGEDIESWRNFTCHLEAGHDGDHEAEADWDDDHFTWDDEDAENWAAEEAITNG